MAGKETMTVRIEMADAMQVVEDLAAALTARPDLRDLAQAQADAMALGKDLIGEMRMQDGVAIAPPSQSLLDFRDLVLARAAVVM